MNKYDWIEVGMRLYGAWLMVQGALGIVAILGVAALSGSGVATAGFGQVLATSFVGSALLLMAPTAVGWLANRDLHARRGERPAPPARAAGEPAGPA